MQVLRITPRERVEKEIKSHAKWCKETCTTFSPALYRLARIEKGLPRVKVQEEKELCHSV